MEREKWDQAKWLIYGIILVAFLGVIFGVVFSAFGLGTGASGFLGAILVLAFRLQRILKNKSGDGKKKKRI